MLADGAKVDGPIALRNAILSRPEAFATVLTERMMTYALGRGVEPSDMPVVRSIVKKAAQNNYRLDIHRHEHRRKRAIPDADPAGAGRTHDQSRTVYWNAESAFLSEVQQP